MSADAESRESPAKLLDSLRRFVRPRAPSERCELCSVGLAAEHPHLIETATGQMTCACDACALLFSSQGDMKYRRVPRRLQFLADFRLTDAAWDGLQLPINLAFFLQSNRASRIVALYPSPAGAAESSVASDAWQSLADDNPVLRQFEPDVEALLVNRIGDAREVYRVGVDECYRLVGLIRAHWRGLSGGPAVWEKIGEFFTDLRRRAAPAGKAVHA